LARHEDVSNGFRISIRRAPRSDGPYRRYTTSMYSYRRVDFFFFAVSHYVLRVIVQKIIMTRTRQKYSPRVPSLIDCVVVLPRVRGFYDRPFTCPIAWIRSARVVLFMRRRSARLISGRDWRFCLISCYIVFVWILQHITQPGESCFP